MRGWQRRAQTSHVEAAFLLLCLTVGALPADSCIRDKPELLARASLYYCSNDIFLELAQRDFPCAATFLDVGGNKG